MLGDLRLCPAEQFAIVVKHDAGIGRESTEIVRHLLALLGR